MVPRGAFVANLCEVARVLENKALRQGCIIECGTWRGGMSAAIMEVAGPGRYYWFFDSFEGLPPAKEIDGPAALAWQAATDAPGYYDNCAASIDDFRTTLSLTGFRLNRVRIVKGFYENTLPSYSPEPIALLRLDSDWYDSTLLCLRTFWPAVLPGGAILIDDYYTWDGCSRAVHDFLSQQKAPERIEQRPGLAVIIKR